MRLGYVFVSQNRYKILKSCLKLNLTWFWYEQVPIRPENNGIKCVICSTKTKPARLVLSKIRDTQVNVTLQKSSVVKATIVKNAAGYGKRKSFTGGHFA